MWLCSQSGVALQCMQPIRCCVTVYTANQVLRCSVCSQSGVLQRMQPIRCCVTVYAAIRCCVAVYAANQVLRYTYSVCSLPVMTEILSEAGKLDATMVEQVMTFIAENSQVSASVPSPPASIPPPKHTKVRQCHTTPGIFSPFFTEIINNAFSTKVWYYKK